MTRNILILFFSFCSVTAYAVDDDYEKLSRANELASKRLQLSNANLAMLKNENERLKVKKELNQMGSEILAISHNILFVKQGNIVNRLTVGDRFKGSTIKSISASSVKLTNGKTYNATK